MKHYDHKTIEAKWQAYWDEHGLFEASEKGEGEKQYILDMFPYPSSAGLHVGHPEGYTATDIVSRFERMRGKQVLHPMGWDAFGLPAENFAIKQGVHPQETTWSNIENFKRQIKSLGFSYDWSREVNTASPDYYRWTQWLFLELYNRGLAYKKQAPVNWCESCQTVLAREQVVDGKCERCGHEVVQKDLAQWFFKITDFADRLLEDLEGLDWPEPIKLMQTNWIGRSEGGLLTFAVGDESLEVFTTRPDTVFGATYMVIAPEHKLIHTLEGKITNIDQVKEYVEQSGKKSELERTDLAKEKTGVPLEGIKAINPATGEEIPVWVADYVLAGYGTGAIMAVPGHDVRDWEFAKQYNLPVVAVIDGGDVEKEAHVGEGSLTNSGEFDGLSVEEGKQKIVAWLGERGAGELSVNYRLRDWLVSRQRYWGAPIPILYCEQCGEVPVAADQLPVELPDDVDFRPTGESPLARSEKFHKVSCPKCGAFEGVRREVDTMDTFVDSSWYFLRYADAGNDTEFASKEALDKWCPVDLYVGGAEHAVLHLLYARFVTKALQDAGHVDFSEPFLKLRNQGMILAEDGRKMSKSLGNVINPDDVVAEYGADTLRLYEMFMGPLEDSKPWSTKSIIGVRRFLEKFWLVVHEVVRELGNEGVRESDVRANGHSPVPKDDTPLTRLAHRTLKKVTSDIEQFKFNTAISAMMIYLTELAKNKESAGVVQHLRLLSVMLNPFAPHMTEEVWQLLGGDDSVMRQSWPGYDDALTQSDTIELVLSVNGKVRDKMQVSASISEDEAKELALASEKVRGFLEGKEPKKVIFVKGKLVNIVI